MTWNPEKLPQAQQYYSKSYYNHIHYTRQGLQERIDISICQAIRYWGSHSQCQAGTTLPRIELLNTNHISKNFNIYRILMYT